MKKLILILCLALLSVSAFAQTSVPRYELITVSGTDTYTAGISPTPSLVNGFKVMGRFGNTNTGASTFNLQSTGAIALRKSDGSALSSGYIPAGSVWWLVYDATSTQWKLNGSSETEISLKHDLYPSTNTQTASYELILSDAGKLIEMNVGSANDVTIPLNSSQAFPINTYITVSQYGAGLTSIVATGGVTVRSSSGVLTSPGQYSPMVLKKIGTDEWYLWNGSIVTGQALTAVDDTNVIATLGGTPSTSLLAATSITLGWNGDLAYSRLTQGSALSVLGVTGNSTADVASIAAATDNHVLRRSGTSVGFGVIQASIIQGSATNDNATAGYIGEETNSGVSTYTNYTTTATYQNITSITLAAGDYEISASGTFFVNSATLTAASDAIFVVSTTTASASGATEGKTISYLAQAPLLAGSHQTVNIKSYRVSISGSTTYYLNSQATFTLGNPQFVGSIRALRVR